MRCFNGFSGGKDGAGDSLTPAAPSRPPFILLLTVLLSLAVPGAQAQQLRDPSYGPEELEHQARLAFSQNLADYLSLGTLNADLQYSIHRRWTLEAGAKYNNWTWRHRQEEQFEARQQAYYVGVRWWPWYTYSGWWVGTKMQYREYNRGGLFRPEAEEGDAFGAGASGGYSVHVNPWLNVDFGIGFWGGVTKYVTYACPYCGRRVDEGTKFFLLPDEVRIALELIF